MAQMYHKSFSNIKTKLAEAFLELEMPKAGDPQNF